jgi:urease accessory protein
MTAPSGTSPDLAGFLAALQIGDSLLPTGRFVYSYGLEAWTAGADGGSAALESYIATVVCEAVAPLDGVLVAHAHRAASVKALIELDDLTAAFRLTRLAMDASVRPGEALLELGAAMVDDPLLAGFRERAGVGRVQCHFPVVLGALGRALGISCAGTVALELQGVAGSMLSAAVRLGAIPPSGAQLALHRLRAMLVPAVEGALTAGLDDLRSTAPEFDVMQMLHEHAGVKHFAS